MSVIESEARPVVEVHGNFLRGVAVAATGARESEIWAIRMAPGASTPPHTHDAEELVYVLAGELTAQVDGSESVAGAGEVLVVPAGALHQLHNRGTMEIEKFAVLGKVGARTFLPDGTPFETPWQS
jgi:quercetin dioxygenase-like cupin family protein